MNKQNRMDTCKTKCDKCGIFVSNLRKHKARKRCQTQHIRKNIRKFQLMAKKMEWLNSPLPFYTGKQDPIIGKHCAFPVATEQQK